MDWFVWSLFLVVILVMTDLERSCQREKVDRKIDGDKFLSGDNRKRLVVGVNRNQLPCQPDADTLSLVPYTYVPGVPGRHVLLSIQRYSTSTTHIMPFCVGWELE